MKFFFNHDNAIMEISHDPIKNLISKLHNVKYSARGNVHNISLKSNTGNGGKVYFVSNNYNHIVRIFSFDDKNSKELLIDVLYLLGFSTGNVRLLLSEAEDHDVYYIFNKRIYYIKMINGFFDVSCVKIP